MEEHFTTNNITRLQITEKYENRWIYLSSIFCMIILLFSSVVVISTHSELQKIDEELKHNVEEFKYVTDKAWEELAYMAPPLSKIFNKEVRNKRDVQSAYAISREAKKMLTTPDQLLNVDFECPAGLQGPKGAPGDSGEIGKNGVPGNTGKSYGEFVFEAVKPSCIWCPVGPVGQRGSVGAPGVPGINGTNGLDGRNGRDGIPGAQGPSGDAGSYGVLGKMGQPGLSGVHGQRFIAAKGLKGALGQPGPIGSSGEIGTTGRVGLPGLLGEKGPAGQVGKNAIPGIPGNVGNQGKNGKDLGYCECPGRIVTLSISQIQQKQTSADQDSVEKKKIYNLQDKIHYGDLTITGKRQNNGTIKKSKVEVAPSAIQIET